MALLLVIGCDRTPARPAAGPTPPPATRAVGEPVPAAALGLGPTLTTAQAEALEARARRHGRYVGTGCGGAFGADGKMYGAFSNSYEVPARGGGAPEHWSFGHLQNAPPGVPSFISVSGPSFDYQFVDGSLVLRRPTPEQP